MIAFQNLIVGAFFSFIGSIPPGTINLSVIQYSLQGRLKYAFQCSLAAAIVEFFYAAIAIKLQIYITSQPQIQSNFKLISASVLLLLGALNLFTVWRNRNSKQVEEIPKKDKVGGFLRGLFLGLANPLAIPFWIAVTAYLQSQGWVDFENSSIWSYVSGITIGTIALLLSLTFFGFKASRLINRDNKYIKIIPGLVLVALGLYAFAELLLGV